jgi:PAT family beta-lactamase induction signal transducer AmpG
MKISAKQLINTLFTNRRLLIILLLGFSSGLPAALTASTLQAWFTEAGLNLYTIGAVTLLVLPYSFRFLWAPLFDYLKVPGFDLRRGWLFLTQLGLILTICLMALYTPQQIFTLGSWSIPWLMVWGFLTAVLSTSQDIVINAYQIEILAPEERGLGASVYVMGWRVGAIISGALGLVLAKELGWKHTYFIMAGLMTIGLLATYCARPATVLKSAAPSLVQAVIAPIRDFFERYGLKTASLFFLLIITYKAGDALALALNTTFLLRHLGFDLATVGLVNKTVSLFAALAGGIVAGVCMTRMTLYRALLFFGLIQGAANLSYAAMAYFGKSLMLLILAAFTENFCSGMGTIALLALIMSLCNLNYTATQFALLSAIAFLARTFVGPIAAWMVDSMGWFSFFIVCFLVSLPTLFFVYATRNSIQTQPQSNREVL